MNFTASIRYLVQFGRTHWSIIASAFIYTTAAGISAGVPLILLPILTRLFSPEAYGQVAMFAVVVQIFGIVAGLSVHGSVGLRYFDRDTIDFPRYVASCLAILFCSSAFGLLFVLLAHSWLENFTHLPLEWLLLAILVAVANFVIQIQLSIWQSAKSAVKFGALRVGQAVMDLSLSLLFVVALGFSWEGRASGMLAATVLVATVAFLALVRGNWIRFPIESSYVRRALRFGIPLVPHAIGGMLIAMADRLMISNILDVGSTGIYMVALQIGMVLNLVNDAFNRAYSPLLIEALKSENLQRDIAIIRFSYAYFIALLLVGGLLGAIAPFILNIIAGPSFQSAGPIVIYIALGQAFGGMYYVVSTYVFYAGSTAKLAIITLSSGTLNVVLSYWLLTTKGLPGVALAFLISQAMLFFGTWWLAQRSRPMPWLRAIVGLTPDAKLTKKARVAARVQSTSMAARKEPVVLFYCVTKRDYWCAEQIASKLSGYFCRYSWPLFQAGIFGPLGTRSDSAGTENHAAAPRWKRQILTRAGSVAIAKKALDVIVRSVRPAIIFIRYLNWMIQARRLIEKTKPNVIVLFEENASDITRVMPSMAHNLRVPYVIIPQTIPNPDEPKKFFRSNPMHSGSRMSAKIISWLAPQWRSEIDGRSILRLRPAEIISLHVLGLSTKTPWLLNSGNAMRIYIDSPAIYEHHRLLGFSEKQLQLCGHPVDDTLNTNWMKRDRSRRELENRVGFCSGRPLVVVGFPADQFDGGDVSQFEHQSFENLCLAWKSAFSTVEAIANVVICAHPRVPISQIALLEGPGRVVSNQQVETFIPLADLYIGSSSATIRWALGLGIPTINYDCYRYRYSDYDSAKGLVSVDNAAAFTDVLRRFLRDTEFGRELRQRASDDKPRWGLVDGRFVERFQQSLNQIVGKA